MKYLNLADSALTTMHMECAMHLEVETGGILIGESNTDDITAFFAVGSGPKARRTPGQFKPDVEWQQERLDKYFYEYGYNYVGSFHRHPGSLSKPSMIDHGTALQILSDPEWAAQEIVFPIILLQGYDIVVYPYYICRADLNFKPMAMWLVPDAHSMANSIATKDKAICLKDQSSG